MKKMEYPLLGEVVYREKVQGLPCYLVPRRGFARKHAILGVNYGAMNLEFTWQGEKHTLPPGIAHYLEHLLFQQEEGDAYQLFPSLGGSANAFTSHSTTAYYFSTTENFYPCLSLLLNFIHQPYFPEENVAKEREVISREIEMEEDSASWKAWSDILQALFVNHPLREEIAGTLETIVRIDRNLLELVHSAFYVPENMVLIVVGDLEPDRLEESVFEFYEKLDISSFPPKGETIFPSEPREVHTPHMVRTMDISQPYFLMGHKDMPLSGASPRDLMRRELEVNIGLELIFGQSGNFYTELYDEQLIDSGFSQSFSGDLHYGYSLLGGETRNGEELALRLVEKFDEVRKEGFCAEAFQRIKNKTLGQFVGAMDSVGAIANLFLDHTLRDFLPFDALPLMDEITLEEVEKTLGDHLQPINRAQAMVLPLNQSAPQKR